MVSQLTTTERQLALVILAVLGLCGLAMASAGRADPLGVHGLIVVLASVAMVFVVIAGYYNPEPGSERLSHYYDDPSKVGIVLAMIWAVF
jgi:cytochrome c oxidase cbb3-type subunit 1